MTDERRTLTDDDLDEIWRRMDASFARHMETIGYDTSTPQARADIHADHSWVRGRRTGEGRVLKASFAALGIAALVGLGHFIWDLLTIGAGALLKAKGGP